MDTIKVRIQEAGSTYSGALNCASRMVREEGMPAFFRGIAAPMVGSTIECATLFYVYSSAQRLFKRTDEQKPLSLPVLATCGSAAGFAASIVMTPFELIKCKLQVPGMRYRGTAHCAYSVVRHEGVRGLYLGWTPTMVRETCGNFFWYGCYEAVCRALAKEGQTKSDLSVKQLAFAGGCGGVMFWTAFFPADVVKTRVQVNDEYRSMGFLRSMAVIYKRGGMAALYSGYTLTILRAFPSNAILFSTYEVALRQLEAAEKALHFI
jgi:solute carrier family 25 carnitine/acylcarnitine transporter 20/29